MSEVVIAEEVAKTAWTVIKPFAKFIACAAVGFAAAEVYEHKVPWGLDHKLKAAEIQIGIRYGAGLKAGIQAQADADKKYFDLWAMRVAQDDEKVTAARNDAADVITKAQSTTSKQSSAAYQLGRATCGASHVPSTSGHPGAGPAAPGGVLDAGSDFSSLYAAGAYTPAR